jgi:hypothetical protein
MIDDDPEVLRLESLLSRYRTDLPPLDLARTRPVWRYWSAAAAAILVIVVSATVLYHRPHPAEWRAGDTTLRIGQVIRASAPLRLESSIGTVDVAPNTTIALAGRSRLDLRVGTIHARTTSPPGVFIVEVPDGMAIDLGCEYTLSVTPQGNAFLHVRAGWVALEPYFAQSIVPAGASAELISAGRVTPPLFDDAAPSFKADVRAFALMGDDAALGRLLPLARRRDALTLLNLFRIATNDERLMLWDRLNELVPAPPSVPRDAVRAWTMRTTDPWWPPVLKASGVRPMKKKARRP